MELAVIAGSIVNVLVLIFVLAKLNGIESAAKSNARFYNIVNDEKLKEYMGDAESNQKVVKRLTTSIKNVWR